MQPTFLPSLTLPLSAGHTLLAVPVLLFSGTILLSRHIFSLSFTQTEEGEALSWPERTWEQMIKNSVVHILNLKGSICHLGSGVPSVQQFPS